LTTSTLYVILISSKENKRKEVLKMETNIILEMQCPFCGKRHTVMVDELAYHAYLDGMKAQNAFPNLTAAQREQIISHLCPKCIEQMF
jgi:ribosomal protein L37AE/L43A